MNFYVLTGQGAKAAVLAVTLDKAAQDDLTGMFKRLADAIVEGDHVAFDPGYRADEGEVVTLSSYELSSGLSLSSPSPSARWRRSARTSWRSRERPKGCWAKF